MRRCLFNFYNSSNPRVPYLFNWLPTFLRKFVTILSLITSFSSSIFLRRKTFLMLRSPFPFYALIFPYALWSFYLNYTFLSDSAYTSDASRLPSPATACQVVWAFSCIWFPWATPASHYQCILFSSERISIYFWRRFTVKIFAAPFFPF